MATTKTKNNLDTLRWGNFVALSEKPEGIQNKSFVAKPSPKSNAPAVTQNITTESPTMNTPKPKAHKLGTVVKTSPLDERVATISQEVKMISSLEALRSYYDTFTHVQLCNTATQLVFGDGTSHNPTAMVIGKAPGADEDIQGNPFIGKSGQLLDKILSSVNLSRKANLYILNVVPWRPPPRNRNPMDKEIKLFTPLILCHIELVNPKFLILAGAVSIQAILGNVGGISRIHGRAQDVITPHEQKNLKAMPIYHPSYLLRSPRQKAKAWEDMIQVKLQLLDN